MDQTLFRSDNLLVRRAGMRGGTVIVTFGSYTTEPILDRPGFAEEFLRTAQIDAIHVINRRNRWYQHPERPAALAAIAAVTGDYDRVITYGSSMGGYAALRYALPCGADTAIALSPQFSADPRIVPWETRWQADVARTRFDEPAYHGAAHEYVLYDPRVRLDQRHAEMIAGADGATCIPIPFGGHPVGPLLVETGALQQAIRSIVAGDFDPASVRARIRRERRRSQHQHFVLARHCAARRPQTALRLLERAAEIEPESHILSAQAALLDDLGRFTEAAPLHHAAVTRTPGNAHAWAGLARHRELLGNTAAAADTLRMAAQRQSGSMLLFVRARQVRLWLRRHRLGALDRWAGRAIARSTGSRLHACLLRTIGRCLR
ncbi:hypothetical protein LQ954_08995 [Sphingomonas sp. IC-11]|uniref:tetratricopeptide repeat protein n=1 Tax=Sphingomonas sp. IC-11 TaxID=2898528 RepID=UPI001E3FFF31|nr:tetratricopeptide repeat protein [Sphingomonas sp. IC-11]MCD2316284.1 hypothetical protein [Sphingomonas sp. IC-11]